MHRCQDIPSLIRAVDNFQKRRIGKRERESSLPTKRQRNGRKRRMFLNNECFFRHAAFETSFRDQSRRELSKKACRQA